MGGDLGYTDYMPENEKRYEVGSLYDPNITDTDKYVPYTDDPVESAKVAKALELLERPGTFNNYCFLDGTPIKHRDLYKEIIEGTGGNPPNESP